MPPESTPSPADPLLQSLEARAILDEAGRRFVAHADLADAPMATLQASAPAPGWTTTEFWLSVLSLLGVFCLILADKLDAQSGLLALASIVPGYAISRGLSKRGLAGAVTPALALAGCLWMVFALSGCAGSSPFTPASNPTAGKIPVKVVLGTQASGNTADPARGTDYSASGQVIFGQGQPWYRRFLSLFAYGPLTPEDVAFWDANLRAEAEGRLPHVGVVHYPGEAP